MSDTDPQMSDAMRERLHQAFIMARPEMANNLAYLVKQGRTREDILSVVSHVAAKETYTYNVIATEVDYLLNQNNRTA